MKSKSMIEKEIYETLISMHTSSGNLWHELTQILYRDLPEFVRRMEVALNQSDWMVVASLCHTLKSMVGNVGALTLSDEFGDMEVRIRTGSQNKTEVTETWIRHVQQDSAQLLLELKELEGVSHESKSASH